MLFGSLAVQFIKNIAGPVYFRAVGGSENSGVPVLYGGHNLPPLVEIGLTDLPKFGGAMAPPAPPGTTGLRTYRLKMIAMIEFPSKKPVSYF